MSRVIATFFGIGHLAPASGTWASAATVILAVGLYLAGFWWAAPVGAVVATLAGLWVIPQVIAGASDKDPSFIVIDEVAGQLLALSFTFIPLARNNADILAAWPGFVVPFLLFRLFDIWKPWLVGIADRRGDAFGVMLDDLWAGLFAGIASVVLAGIYHGLAMR